MSSGKKKTKIKKTPKNKEGSIDTDMEVHQEHSPKNDMDNNNDQQETDKPSQISGLVFSANQVEEKTIQDIQMKQDKEDKENQQQPMAAQFDEITPSNLDTSNQYRRVNVPPHRVTPLRNSWEEIYKPIVEHMKLQIRYNTMKKCVELRTSVHTSSSGALQKAADFVRAFILGFELRDAIAMLRLDDIYVDSFEIKDVKTLDGEHLSRAIGRIAGQGGKTKFAIENATKTRVVLADTHIHIMGSFQNIRNAKDAVVRLIMGSPPGKVYTKMRTVANRMKERF